MRTITPFFLLGALLGGCAGSASSVAERAYQRFERLCVAHRFSEAAFEYEYASANRRVALARSEKAPAQRPLDRLLNRGLPLQRAEWLIAWAEEQGSLRTVGPAAHRRLAFMLDKPEATPAAELARYFRENRNRLWFDLKTDKFRLLPPDQGVVRGSASAEATGSAGRSRDDPLSVSQGSYSRFTQLCRERRYLEAAIEYEYCVRNHRHACASRGMTPGVARADPLVRSLRKRNHLDVLIELAHRVDDFPGLQGKLRVLLCRFLDKPSWSLAEMVKYHDENRDRLRWNEENDRLFLEEQAGSHRS